MERRWRFNVILLRPWFSSINFIILINLLWVSCNRSDSTIQFTKIIQILTKFVRIFLSTIGRYSQSETLAYTIKNIYYWSAVKLENPSPSWILPRIWPKSDGIWNSFIFFWILFKEFDVKIPLSIQIRFTIHHAMPKNKQCIGSIVINFIGSKYGKCNNSDHLTPFCFTNYFCEVYEL